jgi:hypothetical protein
MLVMVPTRGRPEQCRILIESYEETVAGDAGLLFITDDDDDSYKDMDWGGAVHAVLSPRDCLTGILNRTALMYADEFDVLMTIGDDHVIRTPGWDKLLLAALDDMGGSGWVYPDDRRRNDVPEIWAMTADVVKALGFFAIPDVSHFFCDNATGELGKRSGLLRYCPEAVIEHMHYSVTGGPRDATYAEAEDNHGGPDREAYRRWLADKMPGQVAILRRTFSPDVKWILGKVLGV